MRIISGNIEAFDRKWWDELYLKHQHVNTDEELGTFKKAAELAGEGPVLDVGCGEGEASQFFADYHGIDWSPVVIERATKRFGKKFSVGDVEDVTKHYKTALLSQVFEHLKDPKDYIRRILKVADQVVVIIPNDLVGEQIMKNDAPYLQNLGVKELDYHYATYNVDDIKSMFPGVYIEDINHNIIFVCRLENL